MREINTETVFRRGRNDTVRAMGTVRFWLLEVIGGGLMGIYVSPVAALIFIVGMVVAIWIGATASAPIKQRNEARKALGGDTEFIEFKNLLGEAILAGRMIYTVNQPDRVSTFLPR